MFLVSAALECYGRQDEVITLVESSTKLTRSDVDQHTQYVSCLFKLDSLSCWLENIYVGIKIIIVNNSCFVFSCVVS